MVRFRLVMALALGALPGPCFAAEPATPAAARPTADGPRAAAAAGDSTLCTLYIVRHAEKNTIMAGNDPPLTGAGLARARALLHTLGDAGIRAIYVTPWLRNRQTALPLATALGESLTVVDDVAETIRCLRSDHWGHAVLVVGHSNTVPRIIEALTGQSIPPFAEGEVDRIYLVTLHRGGRSELVGLRFGEPSPR